MREVASQNDTYGALLDNIVLIKKCKMICSDNSNNGTYTVTDNMINLTNSNGEEFTIETDNGNLEEGKSYILADDTNFTVSKIIQAGC